MGDMRHCAKTRLGESRIWGDYLEECYFIGLFGEITLAEGQWMEYAKHYY